MNIEILHDDRLVYWAGRIDLPAEAVEALRLVARATHEDAVLYEIFAAFYEQTSLRGEWHREYSPLPMDPRVLDRLGEQRASLFYLLGYMAALPHAEEEYRRRGISLDIFDATMRDIRTWLLHIYDLYGVWQFKEFVWIWHHLSCDLFRLGRLQFRLENFSDGVRAFRHKTRGEIRLLADPNLPLREDGYAHAAGTRRTTSPAPEAPPGQAWLPTYEECPDGWRGHLVAPRGYALRQAHFLPRDEWELALQPGDTVLDLHIPRKDPFTVEDCRASLAQAFDFFARYAPERPFKACYCHTWFFTPQLQSIMPPQSNVVRFQREFYLYPYAGSLDFLWSYVFGEKAKDLAGAPRVTSMQRAVAAWLEQGGEIFDLPGLMFHGPEEWGTQPYMRAWESTLSKA